LGILSNIDDFLLKICLEREPRTCLATTFNVVAPAIG
jgi:hypothetical protein